MKYYIAIADIHGNYNAMLKALSDCDSWIELQKLNGTIKESDSIQFVFLGDYIDRYDKPKEVILKVKEYVEQRHAICLLGNHDMFMIGTADGTSIYFEEHKRSASNEALWWNNGGLKTCQQMFGIKMDDHFRTRVTANAYYDSIKDSEEYKFLKKHGKLKHETDLIFFSHSQQSDPKSYTDDILLWGRDKDYGKPDSAFKVPGNKAMSVHGHFHRVQEGIFFPRIHHYIHGGKAKTVVMADSGCSCHANGQLHPVIIGENSKEENGITDYVGIIAIL